MEFLDPQKQKKHTARILIGYVFISVALVVATTLLIYSAYGFGIKNGEVVQNGLVFLSSNPSGSIVKIAEKPKLKYKTNTHFLIESGKYTLQIQRDGYNTWRRAISVDGGTVSRFDYPLLFPSKLDTTTVKTFTAQPTLVSQSTDHRWLLTANSASPVAFDVLDLTDIKSATSSTNIVLPAGLLKTTDGVQTWQVAEWATDSRHVLLRHIAQKDAAQTVEYILLDTQDVTKSINLTTTLSTTGEISLRNSQYDQFYVFDKAAATVARATIKKPALEPLLQGVLQFKASGDDTAVYATSVNAIAGKVNLMLYQSGKSYKIRSALVADKYILDVAHYSDVWYVVVGSPVENRTYVYGDPAVKLRDQPTQPLVPEQVFKVAAPNHVSFSVEGRFVVIENGKTFGVYDAENEKGYQYDLSVPIDASQEHATWMDGARLQLVSGGKNYVFEFDHANQATLMPVLAGTRVYYSKDYKYAYSLASQTTKDATGKDIQQINLTSTPLRTAKDL